MSTVSDDSRRLSSRMESTENESSALHSYVQHVAGPEDLTSACFADANHARALRRPVTGVPSAYRTASAYLERDVFALRREESLRRAARNAQLASLDVLGRNPLGVMLSKRRFPFG